MNKTIRYIIYIVIFAICLLALLVGVYNVDLSQTKKQNRIVEEIEEPDINENETVNNKFKQLFTNDLFASKYDDSKIAKYDATKGLVYSEEKKASKEGQYKLDICLPIININSETSQKFNNETIANFANRAITLLNSETVPNYTIYDTSYTSYINNNILSIAIMGTLKEGNNPQRLFIKTYNYNLDTGKEVSFTELIEEKGIDTSVLDKKISDTINESIQYGNSVAQTGYEVFKRKKDDPMYNIKNIDNFMIGPGGVLYIIFAYGNSNNTSEMDIVEIGY